MAIDFTLGAPSVQLTNAQRAAMGLTPVGEDWAWGRLPGVDSAPKTEYWAAFQGDILRKALVFSPNLYEEREMAEQSLEGRSKLLPRSGKGNPRPISGSDLERKPLGMYLRFWGGAQQQQIVYNGVEQKQGVHVDDGHGFSLLSPACQHRPL